MGLSGGRRTAQRPPGQPEERRESQRLLAGACPLPRISARAGTKARHALPRRCSPPPAWPVQEGIRSSEEPEEG
eukprot:15442067-Alexandrium_andersonii.AAC.1